MSFSNVHSVVAGAATQFATTTSAFVTQGSNFAGRQIVALGAFAKNAATMSTRFGYDQITKIASLVQAIFRQLVALGSKGIATVSPYLSHASQTVMNLLRANARDIKIISAAALTALVLAYLANRFVMKEAELA